MEVLEVGQRLAQLAVDHAQEVERLVELQEEGVDQDDVADGERAGDHALAPHHHDRGDADGDDRGLAGVERGEVSLRLRGAARRRPARGRGGSRSKASLANALTDLVVDQAVDRWAAELVVALVHLAPERDAPVGGDDGEHGVGGDRGEGDQRERPGVPAQQDADDQDELDRVGPTLNRPASSRKLIAFTPRSIARQARRCGAAGGSGATGWNRCS